MITVAVIRNGANYLSHHLRKNDYWTEGEKEVRGEWIGEAAKALGLEGAVTDKLFDALRQNRHPKTGEALTARDQANRVAFFDVQLSAPKDVSALALVGGDDRIREAFTESVKTALAEMERFAAVRERRGDAAGTEAYRLTRNFVGALFFHDASRDLDPQLHGHAVLANATWDAARNEWLALQPVEMLRASAYLRQVLYRELAGRLRSLGYEPYEMNSKGFSVRGVEHLRERFSKRARHVQKLAEEYAVKKGRKPTKREVEILVRESREDKLTDVSTAEVRARQRAELNADETHALNDLVRAARAQAPRMQWSHGNERTVLEAALRHVYVIKRYGRLAKGDLCPIVGTNERGVVLVKNGRRSTMGYRHTHRLAIATERETNIARGDRLQLKFNGKSKEGHAITNGELVTVRRVHVDGSLTIEDDRQTVKTLSPQQRLFNRGYAVTSYASQGKTVDTVLLADAACRAATNRNQWYVAISRGRKRAIVFTDSKADLRASIEQSGDRGLALEMKLPGSPDHRGLRERLPAWTRRAMAASERVRLHEAATQLNARNATRPKVTL
jgi:conjugative relaxase-like TrwC/TraI family protein